VGEAGEKRVSKAEVLVHANQYIQELEEEMRVLEEKNKSLEECVEGWKEKWTKLGDRSEVE
jgi:flagellar biosynthesis chaperone FliJ